MCFLKVMAETLSLQFLHFLSLPDPEGWVVSEVLLFFFLDTGLAINWYGSSNSNSFCPPTSELSSLSASKS